MDRSHRDQRVFAISEGDGGRQPMHRDERLHWHSVKIDVLVGIKGIRDIDFPDWLGRSQINTDIASDAGELNGQRVLITGISESIESEPCRQNSQWCPTELITLNRDESALHGVRSSLQHRALIDPHTVMLAVIRDEARIRDISAYRRPQVVLQAAVLKPLPMLEQYPAEAIKIDIWGTLTVANAIRTIGVRCFAYVQFQAGQDCNDPDQPHLQAGTCQWPPK